MGAAAKEYRRDGSRSKTFNFGGVVQHPILDPNFAVNSLTKETRAPDQNTPVFGVSDTPPPLKYGCSEVLVPALPSPTRLVNNAEVLVV